MNWEILNYFGYGCFVLGMFCVVQVLGQSYGLWTPPTAADFTTGGIILLVETLAVAVILSRRKQ